MVQLTMVLHTLCNCMREIDGVSPGIPPNIRVALPGGGQRIFAHQSSDPPYHHYREVVEESQAFKPPKTVHTLDPVDEKLREEAFESTRAMRERLKAAEPQLTPQQRSDVQQAIDAYMAGLCVAKPDPPAGGAFTLAMAQQAAQAVSAGASYHSQYMAQPRYGRSPLDPDSHAAMQMALDKLVEDHQLELKACSTDAERLALMRQLMAAWIEEQEAKRKAQKAQAMGSLLRAPVTLDIDKTLSQPPFNGLPRIPAPTKVYEPEPVKGVRVKDPKGLWKPFWVKDKRRVKG